MADVEGGPVLPHVQAFADEIDRLFSAAARTYEGHDPSRVQALDCWDTGPDLDAVAQFAIDNLEHFGIRYVIWRQRIYNEEIASYWRQMADRGSPTQNHMDHVHVSFYSTGNASPLPNSGGFLMALSDEEQADLLRRVRYTEDLVKAISVEVAKQADVLRGKDGVAADVDELLRNAGK